MKCINCGGNYNRFHEDFFICENCGLFKNTKYPSQDDLRNKLSNFMLSASRKKEIEERRLGKAKIQIETINQHYPNKGKVFDVAAAGGFFMKVAQDDGWIVEGNEISSASIKWAKEHYNLNIKYGYFEDVETDDDYDVIVFWNTLEHMHNPVLSLIKAHKILKENGLIYIRVPNRNVNNFKNYVEKFHAYEFNPNNLDNLLKNNGFEKIFIKEITDEDEPMDLMYIKK